MKDIFTYRPGNAGGMVLNANQQQAVVLIKKLIWTYFLLLIFEGALRKWVLPGLANPLLIIRDPFALLTAYMAYRHRLLRQDVYVILLSVLTLASFVATLGVGHGNLMVAVFGARIIWIHFLFMAVMGQILDHEDVVQMGKALLWIAVPMAVLIGLQFYSPQSAWVNRGVGGSTEGAGFSGAQGYFRPPGTFSFTIGNVQFFSLAAAFVFYFWFNPSRIPKFLLIGATFATIAAVPLSISRGLLFQIAICFIFMVIAVSGKPKFIGQLIAIVFFGALILMVLQDTSFFKTATGAFTERIETANEAEGGMESMFIDRFLGGLVTAFTANDQDPFFGAGLGMGTNVGAQLMFGTSQKFVIAEGEWGRVVGEMGALLGVLFIFIRSHFSFHLLLSSFRKIKKGDILPWIIMSFGFLILLQGQWAQPTSQGFAVVVGGMVMAAVKNNTVWEVRQE